MSVSTLPKERTNGKDIDWEAVERDYRIGKLSLREMGKIHGVAYGHISDKAKERGWTRDLGATIRSRARAKLDRTEADPNATDEQVAATVAEAVARVLGSHRIEIKKLRGMLSQLGDQLNDVMKTKSKTPATIRQRVDLVRAITSTLKELVALERESYDVENQNEAPPAEVDPNDIVELARRTAFVLRMGVERMKDGNNAA